MVSSLSLIGWSEIRGVGVVNEGVGAVGVTVDGKDGMVGIFGIGGIFKLDDDEEQDEFALDMLVFINTGIESLGISICGMDD